jgi:integrase
MKRKKRKPRAPKGAGSLYKQPGCEIWYMQFHVDGKRVRESTGETDSAAARQKLNLKLGALAKGDYVAPDKSRTTVADLFKLVEQDYRVNERKSLKHVQSHWKQVEAFFGNKLARNLREGDFKAYIDLRLKDAARATINRELALLRRMLKLGKCLIPEVENLPENNIRTNFVDDKKFDLLAAAATELWMRAFLELAYASGWRREEIIKLRVNQLDMKDREIRLDVGTTKNGLGRVITMSDALYTLLAECVRGKAPGDRVFTRENGRPVKDFRRAWWKLIEAAGLPGLLVHDLRRSAARSLRRAGVAESVIMEMCGWETREMFKRYNIVNTKDVAEAVRLREQKRIAEISDSRSEISHNFSHNSPILAKVVTNKKTAKVV